MCPTLCACRTQHPDPFGVPTRGSPDRGQEVGAGVCAKRKEKVSAAPKARMASGQRFAGFPTYLSSVRNSPALGRPEGQSPAEEATWGPLARLRPPGRLGTASLAPLNHSSPP